MTSHPSAFRTSLDSLLGLEGGFSDDASDSGGATNWGISHAVARGKGYDGPMDRMPLAKAQDIYYTSYWKPLGLDAMSQTHPQIADKLFEQGVHCGIGTAARWLQRTLAVLNQNGALYPDLDVDGIVGPGTRAALDALIRHRGPDGTTVVLRALGCLQGAHYITLAEQRPKDERFVYGWLRQRVGIRDEGLRGGYGPFAW